MKKILVPTDFSDTATNAALYASDMALALDAELHLLHVYHIPNPLKSLPVEIILTPDEFKSDSESHLKQTKAFLNENRSQLPEITLATRNGNTLAEIQDYANFINADLIIIGLHGAGIIKEKIIGSTATSLPHHSAIPVLIVPAETTFKTPARITFASDGNDLGEPSGMLSFLEMAKKFSSQLDIINILSPRDRNDKDPVINRLESVFEGLPHRYHFPEVNDVSSGIHDFVENQQADLLVMIPRKHSFFGHLFGKSHTVKLAFHSKIPLLALPS